MNLKLTPILILLLSSSYAVAQVQPMPSVELATFVGPRGVHREQLDIKQTSYQFFDFRKTVIIANESGANADIYPLQIRFSNPDISVLGVTVIGVQPPELTWSQMKSSYDGDGIRLANYGFKHADSIYIENVEDGFNPVGGQAWHLTNSWLKDIRDDGIENDTLISGAVENTLFDGVFMFLSARPGENATVPDDFNDPTVTITNCLVHVKAFPDDHPKTRYADVNGNACGQLFKWSGHGGTVIVKNTIFRVDQYASRGPTPMNFVAGEYENCTLVWLGEGDYPQPVPPGVTISTNKSVWDNARTEWVVENSWRFPNRHLLKDLIN